MAAFTEVYAYGDTKEDLDLLDIATRKYYRWQEVRTAESSWDTCELVHESRDNAKLAQGTPMSRRTQQTTLSLLWLVVSLNILIADILTLYIPESREILSEVAGDTPISLVMLVGAVFIQIPVLMIPACMLAGFRVRKWLNIIAGLITLLFVVGGGSLFPHYLLLAAVEVVCLVAIIAIAWRSVDTRPRAPDAS